MADNLTQKIIRAHLLEGSMACDEQITIQIDQILTQDLTGILVAQYIAAVDPPKITPEKKCFYCDHNVIAAASEGADDHLFLRTVAEHYGITYSKTGNGICHFLQCQRFAAPGKTLLGSDSHTPTSGALGCLAIGSGGLTVAECAMGMGFKMTTPKVMNINLTGALRPGVSAKDVALEIMKRLTVKGGRGYVLEFTGDGVATLSVSERQTIANMSIETGAFTGIFPVDERTKAFLKAQQREKDYMEIAADKDAEYDAEIHIDLSSLEPLVAKPSMPDNVALVSETQVVPNSVFIGSCTNGSYQDIARAAAILKGKKVHPHIDLTIGPGSRQVLAQLIEEGVIGDLVASGARIIECSCGPCIGIGQVPPHNGIAVRTSNRNFPGRSGTNSASVYLVSPETAAATAIAGCLTDPRTMLAGTDLLGIVEPPTAPVDDSNMIIPRGGKQEEVPIIQGPNISDLPMRGPVRDFIEGCISLKTGDGITTDDIVPSNPETIKYNANIPKVAEYTFAYIDKDFVRRAQEMQYSMIVGGENYGQGSSRESAALLPMYLGVEVLLVKSYARIHKENLFNYGIIPLVFKCEEDYDLIGTGDRYVIRNVCESIRSGKFALEFIDKGLTLEAYLLASDFDKELLYAGGALNYIKNLNKTGA